MELVIGTKAWSTWSMRPWLVLKHAGADFTETVVTLRQEAETRAAIARHSPTGRVPVLKDGELVICDSLAICEYLAEKFPQARLWPIDGERRALGRAAAAEMHAGFMALRAEHSMDLAAAVHRAELSEAVQQDVRRIVGLLNGLLRRHGGPFLLGEWSIADAFYTPVATRFRTYGVALRDHGDGGPAAAYAARLLATPEFLAWEAGA